MGEGNKQCCNCICVHLYKEALPLGSHSLWDALIPEKGYCTAPVFTGSDSFQYQLFLYLKLTIFYSSENYNFK